MRRGAKTAKAKVKAKLPVARKLLKNNGSRVCDLEKRLAEAQEQQTATAEALQTRNRELSEAQEQQAATSQILRVISSSPADVQPVFAAVLTSAARLCDAFDATILQVDGDRLRIVAHEGPIPTTPVGALPLIRGTATGRAVLDRRTIHVPDLQAEVDEYPESSALARSYGFRTVLNVPLLRGAEAIGAIGIRRTEVRPFTDRQIELLETFAAQSVIAIENVRLFNETKESLEQQTATAEILRVIASSPTDVQPVFATILDKAMALADAQLGVLHRYEGDELFRAVELRGAGPEARALWQEPQRLGRPLFRSSGPWKPAQILDVREIEPYRRREPLWVNNVDQEGMRTLLNVPLVSDVRYLGAISLYRREVRAFTDKEIALLQTFAAQAVIAIDNVRLFNETKESLEQQTATAEILRVIASSPTDLQPVMEAVAENAARVCGAADSSIALLEGERLRLVTHHGSLRRTLPVGFTIPATRGTVAGRAVIDRRTIHVDDILAAEAEFPGLVSRMTRAGIATRTILATPLLREGTPLGAIFIARPNVNPFSAKEIALLETFANQAVIAIENVRLFTELGTRNRELTEALEQQTATAEMLQVISQSPTDVQPVFDAIARSARTLCLGKIGAVFRYQDGLIHLAAAHGTTDDALAQVRGRFPVAPGDGTLVGRVIRDRDVVNVADQDNDPRVPAPVRESARVQGVRSQLIVPMLRDGDPIGAVAVSRVEAREFSESHIALLQTFADQAVIAIENVRLFKELEVRNRDLTESLEQQTATGEILRVISRSQTDVQPVFDTIADNLLRLFDAWDAWVTRYEDGLLYRAAVRAGRPEAAPRGPIEAFAPTPELTVGRCVLAASVIHVEDVETDPVVSARSREIATLYGWRSALAAPMLRAGLVIGVIMVTRRREGAFTEREIELIQTFADQAVIAVENVRLFKELRTRTGELERSVDQLTAPGEVSRAVSSTLDLDTVLNTIVTRANELAGTDGCSIFEYDEAVEVFRLRASRYTDPREAATLDPIGRATPIPKGQGLAGWAALRREPVHIPDIAVTEAYDSPVRGPLLQAGYRALLGVPLLREDQVIGVLTVSRKTPGDFPPEVVRVLMTFATQSALAIENARLFREIADKSRQLEAASQHKSEFLANMSHELRTPLNAIIGFSEVLAERMFGEVNEKQAEYLQDILSSGRHLLSLINDILDLSKVEAGRLELELGRFHLPTALDNALTLVRERATRHGITLAQTVDERVGDIVADERKVKQILLNLLSNAVKFTPEGGRVGLTATAADGVLTIAVTDTGVGIAPEDQAAIFEEFRQVGREDARKQEGTGLGLTLAKKFVELHGGQIGVQSQVGQGSTFTFILPVRPWPKSAS